MKRLLACLFLVLGLGLLFNGFASAKTFCLKKDFSAIQFYHGSHNCGSNYLKINEETYEAVEITKDGMGYSSRYIYSKGKFPLPLRMIIEEIYNHTQQVVKKEPSQTQQVKQDNKKYIDIDFCKTNQSVKVYDGGLMSPPSIHQGYMYPITSDSFCMKEGAYKRIKSLKGYQEFIKWRSSKGISIEPLLCYETKRHTIRIRIDKTRNCRSYFSKYLYFQQIKMDSKGFYIIDETQIAKKEPTQTQQVAKKIKKITKCPERPEEFGTGMGMAAIYNSCYVMKELWSIDDSIKFFGHSPSYEYFWGHIKKAMIPLKTTDGNIYIGFDHVMQRNGSRCEINLLTSSNINKAHAILNQKNNIEFNTNCGDFSKAKANISYDKQKDIYVVDGQNIFFSDDASKLKQYVEKYLGKVLDTREKQFAARLDDYKKSISKLGEKPKYDPNKSAEKNYKILAKQLGSILRKNYEKKQLAKKEKEKKKVVKVVEQEQEGFKPETKDIDNDPPRIEIAEAITVVSQSYTIKGTVKDKSKPIYLEINGRPVEVKNGKFELERFNIDPDVVEELKIVAIDQWNNRSEKIVKVTVELQSTEVVRIYEELRPNRVKVKTDKDKIAIIIGIEKYVNLTNLDAPFANRDANAFREYTSRAFGVKSSQIKLLVDSKATRPKILEAFKLWLPRIAGDGGKDIYIFFSGHGLASDDGNDLYILPQNGNPLLLEDTAITRVKLISLIQKVNPKSVTMFFDTCYSGQTREERMLVASLKPIRIVADEQDTPDNFTIFSASNFDQTSGTIKEAKYGMFSYYLMKGLEGKADGNQDKQITNGELIAYLKTNVSKEAFSQAREQDPMLSGDPDQILMRYQ